MEDIFIECSPGISGDMLLSAFYDLGVPQNVIEKPLYDIGFGEFYDLSFIESKTSSIRGIRTEIKILEKNAPRNWKKIREIILNAGLKSSLREKIIRVFQSLANSEAMVHGINPESVHFHEIGAIDSIVDILGTCAAVDYLKPKNIFYNLPTLGSGYAQTEHGLLSIPSPAVIDLIKNGKIKVNFDSFSNEGELSTPTGIALLSSLGSSQTLSPQYSINSYGVGIGSRTLSCPNLLRVFNINSLNEKKAALSKNIKFEEVAIQEAWIDDLSPEEIASFVEILRDSGAYDVSYETINMKKDRIGYSVVAILPVEQESYFRDLWFTQSTTLGLRERRQGRWKLLRREGKCDTYFGELKFKQFIKPNGEEYMKPENDEILKLQKMTKKSSQEIRKIIYETMGKFESYQDWR